MDMKDPSNALGYIPGLGSPVQPGETIVATSVAREADTSFVYPGGGFSPPALSPPETGPVKLDLACGLNCREGFEGVDLYGNVAKHKVDLCKFPWPFADNSVDELHCSHFIEHIPAREIEERDLSGKQVLNGAVVSGAHRDLSYVGQDMLFAFFDEVWRILKPGAAITILCPALRSNRAFMDPTHRRFIPAETFLYLDREWRKANGLSHYLSKCHFTGKVDPMVTAELTQLNPEAAARQVNHYWNVVGDWRCIMTAVK